MSEESPVKIWNFRDYERKKLTGIRGWLLFFVIIEVLSIIISVILLHRSFFDLFCYFSIIISIISLVLVFSKKKTAPKSIQITLLVNLAGSGFLDFAYGEDTLLNKIGTLIIMCAMTAVWYFYFKYSRRVNFTFTR